jgi:hypothetical protein
MSNLLPLLVARSTCDQVTPVLPLLSGLALSQLCHGCIHHLILLLESLVLSEHNCNEHVESEKAEGDGGPHEDNP